MLFRNLTSQEEDSEARHGNQYLSTAIDKQAQGMGQSVALNLWWEGTDLPETVP